MYLFKDKNLVAYIVVSLVFILFNLYFINTSAPWGDEVMIGDTPVNFLQGKGWVSHAWNTRYGAEPFSNYPPLMQCLQVIWYSLFGISFVSCKMLCFFLTFLVGFSIYKILHYLKTEVSMESTILMSFLVWGSLEFSIIYRNGRPDILCALLCILLVLLMIKQIVIHLN